MTAAIPPVEVTDDADRLRAGCPHGERCATHRAQPGRKLLDVGTENAPQFLMAAFLNQMLIQFTERGQVAVSIVDNCFGVTVGDGDKVFGSLAIWGRNDRNPDALVLVLHGNAASGSDKFNLGGEWAQHPHGSPPAPVFRLPGKHVCSKHSVRVVVGAVCDRVEQVTRNRCARRRSLNGRRRGGRWDGLVGTHRYASFLWAGEPNGLVGTARGLVQLGRASGTHENQA